MEKLRVILVGGTSHTGKSTLGQTLAEQMGWHYRSTDTLARHPGRPWQTLPKIVPPHVAEHYLSLHVDELIADVVRHYTNNIWPLAKEIIVSHATDSSSESLVMEGSALLPELAVNLSFENVAAVWLTAGDEFLKQRIYRESDYQNKSPLEQEMINKFVERTLRFNERVVETVTRLGLVLVNVENTSNLDELADVCLFQLRKKEGEPPWGGEN